MGVTSDHHRLPPTRRLTNRRQANRRQANRFGQRVLGRQICRSHLQFLRPAVFVLVITLLLVYFPPNFQGIFSFVRSGSLYHDTWLPDFAFGG